MHLVVNGIEIHMHAIFHCDRDITVENTEDCIVGHFKGMHCGHRSNHMVIPSSKTSFDEFTEKKTLN